MMLVKTFEKGNSFLSNRKPICWNNIIRNDRQRVIYKRIEKEAKEEAKRKINIPSICLDNLVSPTQTSHPTGHKATEIFLSLNF